MNDFEKELSKHPQVLPQSKITLIDALYHWLEEKKKPILKEQAYRRELGTIKNQIGTSSIAHYRYQSITATEIQTLLNDLNENGYSYSVIKKTYDTFNSFYRDMSKKERFQNPMDFVSLWRKSNVITEEKEVQFWEDNDIKNSSMLQASDIIQVLCATLLVMHWRLISILVLESVNCSPLLGKTLTLLTI